MRAREIWKAVVMDRVDFLDELLSVLDAQGIRFCLIGGQAVNAYVAPLVSLDLDLAVVQLETVEKILAARFRLQRFPQSLNVTAPGSDLRVQMHTDSRYSGFVARAGSRDVLGRMLPVASLEDVLQGKVWAAMDPDRRASKRRKDLLDIERLLEAYPRLHSLVPPEILDRLDRG